MEFNNVLTNAKKSFAREEKLRASVRVRRVMTFFVDIGLLDTNWLNPLKARRLKVQDVLWVAENIDLRVLEVFPAALIHYPKSFLGLNTLPPELRKIIADIRLGRPVLGMYNGIELQKMVFWANFQLPDRRTRTLSERRVMKTFRFTPNTLARIKQTASQRGISETELIETLVLSAN